MLIYAHIERFSFSRITNSLLEESVFCLVFSFVRIYAIFWFTIFLLKCAKKELTLQEVSYAMVLVEEGMN